MATENEQPDDAVSTEDESDKQSDNVSDGALRASPKEEEDLTVRESLKRESPIVLLVIVAAVLSSGIVLDLDTSIPPEMYLYAFLGAGAYGITSLVFAPKQSPLEVLRLGYRLVGALPLAAGVYLFSDTFVDAESLSYSIAGLAFLSGLFVRLTLSRLSDVAERLYGSRDGTHLPYESSQHRISANTNLWRGWQQLAVNKVPPERRRQAIQQLQRAEDIIEDQDATAQELVRARDLSEEAVGMLQIEEDKELGKETSG